MKKYTVSSKSLTSNSLCVGGLFLAILHGFACFTIIMGGAILESKERLPIVWFVVLFPLLVLISFYRLVTKHH